MRKKYLSALLFGALLFASAGTFTSCKDYDDDINNLQEQINTVVADLASLKSQIGDKGVSSVTFNESTGVLTVVDGEGTHTYTIKTSAGEVDEVKITIDGQDLKVNGVVVGKVGDKVAVENNELTINGEATGIKVGTYAILDNQTTGTVTITLPDADGKLQTVELMKAAISLSSINVINADSDGDVKLEALYDINDKDVEYGPEGAKKTLKAGLYTTLDRDLKIVVNPRTADASLYTFSLKNSGGVDTELKFKTATPYVGTLTAADVTSRATSNNNIWILENDYTRYDNNNLTDIRTNLYEKFKANDVASPYALTLEAAAGTNVYNTPYDLSAELRKMSETTASALDMQYTLINEWKQPIVKVNDGGDESAVYDYWLTLDQSAANLQKAKLYGVEISEDGHSFRFTKEAGIGNDIEFVYNYILVNGTIYEGDKGDSFIVKFAEELASINTKVFDDLIKPFDAALASNDYKMYSGEPNGVGATISGTTFFMTETDNYDYSEFYNALSENDKLVWNAAIESNAVSFELFGGEGGNNLDNKNERLLQNIRYDIDTKKQKIGLQFLVDKEWEDDEPNWGANNNFKLNTAYELVMTVKDPMANNVVAKLTFPFELQQPTMDIVARDGKFSQWKTVGNDKEEYLYSYGAYDGDKMYLPMYESFKAWTTDYTVWDENAQFYALEKLTKDSGVSTLLGQNTAEKTVIFDDGNDADRSGLEYTTKWQEWNTYTAAATAGADNAEKTITVRTSYKHYGVYNETLFTGGKTDDKFQLVFASLLNHSSLKMAEGSETLIANAGTNDVFISNDILNLTTPMGEKFYLFDGLVSGKVVVRTELNKVSFNEDQRPFITVTELFAQNAGKSKVVSAKDKNGTTVHNVVPAEGWSWNIDALTGERSYKLPDVNGDNIKIFNIEACPVVQDPNHIYSAADFVGGHTGGMAIQLPTSIADKEEIEFTITLNDGLGFTKELKFTVKKIQ